MADCLIDFTFSIATMPLPLASHLVACATLNTSLFDCLKYFTLHRQSSDLNFGF